MLIPTNDLKIQILIYIVFWMLQEDKWHLAASEGGTELVHGKTVLKDKLEKLSLGMCGRSGWLQDILGDGISTAKG